MVLQYLRQNNNNLDSTALRMIIKEIEMQEKTPNYDQIIKSVVPEARERIKQAQYMRLNDLTRLH